MKSPAILAIGSALMLTACGRLDSRTAAQLITSSPDFQGAYIERTTVWTGRVPAERIDGPLGELTRKVGMMNCVEAGAGWYNCSLPPLAASANGWERHEHEGYTEYRVPLYEQKLDDIKMTDRTRKTAEATYTFHREPNPWGRKLGRIRPGPAYHFKALFRKYDDGWQVDRLQEP